MRNQNQIGGHGIISCIGIDIDHLALSCNNSYAGLSHVKQGGGIRMIGLGGRIFGRICFRYFSRLLNHFPIRTQRGLSEEGSGEQAHSNSESGIIHSGSSHRFL